MRYLYIDESFNKVAEHGRHYCCVGGVIVQADELVDLELDLVSTIWKHDKADWTKHEGIGLPILPEFEFKATNFYHTYPKMKGDPRSETKFPLNDDDRIELFKALLADLRHHDVEFVVSLFESTKMAISRYVEIFKVKHQLTVLDMGFRHLTFMLEPWTNDDVLQMVIDLGVDTTFMKLTYEIYSSFYKHLSAVRASARDDSFIAMKNPSNVPCPTFLASHTSRVMQMADMVVGLKRAEAAGTPNRFLKRMIEALNEYEEFITLKRETLETDQVLDVKAQIENLPPPG